MDSAVLVGTLAARLIDPFVFIPALAIGLGSKRLRWVIVGGICAAAIVTLIKVPMMNELAEIVEKPDTNFLAEAPLYVVAVLIPASAVFCLRLALRKRQDSM